MKRIPPILFSACIVFVSIAVFVFHTLESIANDKAEEPEQYALMQKRIVLKQIQHLQKANPEQDFVKAWHKHDFRFIGVYDYLYIVPGVTKDQANVILKSKKVNFIKGTGDGTDTPEEKRLYSLAVKYAVRYNKLLNKSLKSK
jgi:hypothetical protein